MRRSLKKHWHNLESCWAYPLGGATHSFARWNKLNAAELNRTLVANVTGSFLIAQATAKPMVMQGRATCLPNLKQAVYKPNLGSIHLIQTDCLISELNTNDKLSHLRYAP
jgi:hypothetical protein